MLGPGSAALPRTPLGWLLVSAASLVAIALLGAAAVSWRRAGARRGRLRLKRVATVSGLFIHPVKSCRGVAVRRAQVSPLGLRSGDLRDRCWLVIKEDGHMVTARQEPRLVLISVTSENGYLTLSAPEMKDLEIPVKLSRKNPVWNCRVFGFDVQGRDCGEEAAQWITAFLNSQPYRLVHFEPNMVPRNSKDFMKPFRPTDKIAYPDCSPVMVLSEASVEELNSRLEKKVQIRNFRPNILVTGCGSFEEDTWDEIIIGTAEMKGTMACPRCILTTVDPDTGVIDRKEPLETLKSYRMCEPSENHIYKSHPLFGWYFGIDKTGTLQVGDPVYQIIRCWTVIQEDGRMLSAKQEPRLLLVSVTCEEGYLILNAPEMKTLRIPVEQPQTNSVWNCRFGIQAQGRDCGDEAAQWITTFLNSEPYRLVHYESNMTTRKPRDFLPPFQPTDQVAYAEAAPILLISEASLEDLNSRLEKKVAITNFRPNIVVTGCGPFEEDTWSEILIGNVELNRRMSCPRCVITTIDPDTGIMTKKEPLETLKSYRKCDPSEQHAFKASPPFGWLYGVAKTGMVQVGDPVYKLI
ncbi:mitochondrial amidoxime reducing component 2-like isoform X2 [Tiliqua scincoides]|uniref:mitochondrial amidoxime reducing component 2-like isoform X2 n=1 Tax=Tiliqua scincoides TaxID=71010 RepID=UPI003462B2CA